MVGGLDASGTSTNRAFVIQNATVQGIAPFPVAQHDAAGATIANALYVFGGGNGTRQLDAIWRVRPDGTAVATGRLPAPSSDSSAVAIGGTAYVVGGFTGTQWLDTVVAYTPGQPARVVARLPQGRRYAATATDGRLLYVFGGSVATSDATTDILQVDPSTGRVTRVGALPRPLTHLAAARFGNAIVVAGGRGTTDATLSDTIYAFDPARRTLRPAGRLAGARRDFALVADGNRLVTVGGQNAAGATGYVGALTIVPATRPASTNVYGRTGADDLLPRLRSIPSRVYVPNSIDNTIDVIDPATFRVVARYPVGGLPQHVTTSWDMRTLYVNNNHGTSLTPIDPQTGRPSGPAIPVADPYNLYFTPDGRNAIVVAEASRRLDFRDPRTMALRRPLPVPCVGVNHMDFTADGSIALASCEFSGQMVVVDVVNQKVLRTLRLPLRNAAPQDVKIAPDGRTFFVADLNAGGVWLVDARAFRVRGFIRTGAGTHGLYPSRDATRLYVSNRGAGTVSVIDFATRRIVATWVIPRGTPDMGGVSVDGSVLWLTGRYTNEVYALSTRDGRLLARIPVGAGPHGLCIFPQPGRYSIGHTCNTR